MNHFEGAMTNNSKQYLVAATKSWNLELFNEFFGDQNNWHLVTTLEEFEQIDLQALEPEFIFFPHWSWIVPEHIVQNYTCVCFHMTDLPFGRGGSPLQNLISRGFKETKLSVLKMSAKLDEGPIFFKLPVSLEGNAEEIYRTVSRLSFEAMLKLVQQPMQPQAQTGEPTYFKRRKPAESQITDFSTTEKIYDHIRMLDAEGYPPAYIEVNDTRFEFSNAQKIGDELIAKVKVVKKDAK